LVEHDLVEMHPPGLSCRDEVDQYDPWKSDGGGMSCTDWLLRFMGKHSAGTWIVVLNDEQVE
jgi:hypothetical protein